MTDRPTEQIMVRVTPSMRAALDREAAQTERTISQIVRLSIRDHLTDVTT